MQQIEQNPNKQRKYVDFIDYYASLSEQEIIEFRKHYLNDEDEIMGLAQILQQEGRQEGLQLRGTEFITPSLTLQIIFEPFSAP